MIEKIKQLLESAGVNEYTICCSKQRTEERYTVCGKNDMRRLKTRSEYLITIYQVYEDAGERFKGKADAKIFPDMTQDEICERICNCIEAARSVGTAYYDHPDAYSGTSEHSAVPEIDLMLERFICTDRYNELLYLELFRESEERRIITSWGTDVCNSSVSAWGELVAGYRKSDCTVMTECFRSFTLSDGSEAEIESIVGKAVKYAGLRGKADRNVPSGEFRVIIEEGFAHELLSMYLRRADASAVVSGISDYSAGIQAAPYNIPDMWMTSENGFSEDGVPLGDRLLLRNGELMNLHGTTKDMALLGLKPSGRYEGIRIAGGRESYEEWKNEPYIRPLLFSDFLMYSRTGDFLGEIRLAEYYDGNSRRMFTGGALHGNLLELQDSMRLSSETFSEKNYKGPAAMLLEGVEVTGGANQ